MELNIASFNVNGLRNEKKRRAIFNYLHDHKHNIVLLQETHSTKNEAKRWKAEWGGKIIFSHGLSNARGVAILIQKKCGIKVLKVVADQEGRVIVAEVKVNESKYKISSGYAPNQDKPEFFVQWFQLIEQCEGSTIMAGDFNTVLDLSKDKKGGKGFTHPRSTNLILEYMQENGLADIWRVQHPEDFRATWSKDHNTELLERIDYFLVSQEIVQVVTKSEINAAFKSDHAIPWILISTSGWERTSGYWKFNTSLLDDDQFREEVKEIIMDADLNIDDTFTKWEAIKVGIRSVAIDMGIKKAKSRNLKLKKLEQKLKLWTIDYENKDKRDTILTDHVNQIKLIQQEIKTIRDYKTEGAMLRSRSEFFEGGEKCTKYFLNMEC